MIRYPNTSHTKNKEILITRIIYPCSTLRGLSATPLVIIPVILK